jgi:hypothetical protein
MKLICGQNQDNLQQPITTQDQVVQLTRNLQPLGTTWVKRNGPTKLIGGTHKFRNRLRIAGFTPYVYKTRKLAAVGAKEATNLGEWGILRYDLPCCRATQSRRRASVPDESLASEMAIFDFSLVQG